jgi:two-component system CheB/CheR fusion protein
MATNDGRWFLVRIMPYRTLENRIDGLVLTFSDISVAKKLEAELRERERDLKALFENLPSGFGLFDSVFDGHGNFINCRFVFVNNAYERMTGVKNDEVQGKMAHEGWPGTVASWIKTFRQVTETGVPGSIDIREPGGRLYHFNIFRLGGNLDRLGVIIEDITQRQPRPEVDQGGSKT